MRHSGVIWAVGIALAAVATYWQAFRLPLISDDYLVIDLAAQYAGAPGGWAVMWSDPLYRTRALFMWLTSQIHAAAGLYPAAYASVCVSLHAVNSILAFRLGVALGWPLGVAGLTGLLFAIHHGHQEAVLWYSALPDSLVLLFALAALWCWHNWGVRGGWTWYAGALLAFATGLASKESAVIVPGLLGGMAILRGWPWRRAAIALVPFGLMSLGYFAASYAARDTHLHFHDGTFALGRHFASVVLRSSFRILWPWGLAAIALLAWRRSEWRAPAAGLGWMALTLLPYSFLTYMPFVPSRHTYVASLAPGALLALGFITFSGTRKHPGRWLAGLVLFFGAVEWGYLWTRKYRQYAERARPTEVLKEVIAGRQGELRLQCFPFPPNMVESLIRVHSPGRVRLTIEPGFRETFSCDIAGSMSFIPD
jgi:hypothetical protein